uniref:hypothetical protein n=1 Tax=Streptomyces acidiscabies TaxID=42234 RepID=UPI001EE7019C
ACAQPPCAPPGARRRRARAPARHPHGIRVYVTAPTDPAAWGRTIAALNSADGWGSTDSSGRTEVWAQIDDEVNE